MAQATREPLPSLRRYVRRYFAFTESAPGPVRRIEGPGTDVIVVLSFGPEWWIGDATEAGGEIACVTSFVAGLHDHAVTTEHAGRSDGMQISFTPPGASALFGLPLHELAGRTVPLDDVFGVGGLVPLERLAGLGTAAERFDVLDECLRIRLARRRPEAAEGVAHAWRCLHASRGRARIASIADDLGWSRKRLALRFREQVGVSPKTLARLIRYERAASELGHGSTTDLARVAAACGFFDQAHLTNEFRRIRGTTPAAYVRETNLQDGEAAAA